MFRLRRNFAFAATLLAILSFSCHPTHVTGGFFSVGKFSQVPLYHHTARPEHVAVFISGDGGWGSDLDRVADDISNMDLLVIGVDIADYLQAQQNDSKSCVHLASEYQKLVRAVEEKLGYEHASSAVIIGHSAGASMVYGILMQAKPGEFRGGISLGFSPGYDSDKPFCPHRGLVSTWNPGTREFDLQTGGKLSVPWIVIHGTADTVCPFRESFDFVQNVPGAKFVRLNGADHSITSPDMVIALKQAIAEIFDLHS